MLLNGGTSERFFAEGLGRLGQAANVRTQRLSLHFSNPHEPRQFGLAHADGPMRSTTDSDYAGSSESAGRSTSEMLHTNVLLVGFDEPLSDLLKNPMGQKHGVLHTADTRPIHRIVNMP